MTHGLVHDTFNILHSCVSAVWGFSTTHIYFPAPWAVTDSTGARLQTSAGPAAVSGVTSSLFPASLLLKCCVESYCDRAAICVIGSHLNKQHTSTDRPRTRSIPLLAALLSSTLWRTHTCAHLRVCPGISELINGAADGLTYVSLPPLLWWICFDYIQELLWDW